MCRAPLGRSVEQLSATQSGYEGLMRTTAAAVKNAAGVLLQSRRALRQAQVLGHAAQGLDSGMDIRMARTLRPARQGFLESLARIWHWSTPP
jgi:hypothetical protein